MQIVLRKGHSKDSNVIMHWQLIGTKSEYLYGLSWISLKTQLKAFPTTNMKEQDFTCSCYFCSFSFKGVKQIAFSLRHTYAVHSFGWRVLHFFWVVVKPYHKKAPICMCIH
jgi:hypothetical protein